MFEEVPRTRRGLVAYLGVSQLTTRRIVLGPFVIGGGVVLAAIGGSVAVAATVFTASTIRASDVPPHPHQPIVVAAPPTTSRPIAPSSAARSVPAPTRPAQPSSASGTAVAPARTPAASPSQSVSIGAGGATTTSAAPPATRSSTTSPSSSAPTSPPSPAGNAVVYVSGWNPETKQLLFEFASVAEGTGPQHSDVYTVASAKQYSASLAADIHVVSGDQLCPPAGNTCTVHQLIDGTTHGFFAELAIDPSASVHQVVERDNVVQFAPSQPIPSPTATSSLVSAQPTA